MGHAENEISAAFAQFDRDGNHVLDADEQKRMKLKLEEKRVCFVLNKIIRLCLFSVDRRDT